MPFIRDLTAISFFLVFFHTTFWREIGGNIGGRAPDSGAADSNSTTSTTTPTPTGPALESFLLRTLSRNCSPDLISINESQWKAEVHDFVQQLKLKVNLQTYSCNGRCGLEQRSASLWPPKCFCDELCDVFGDCCFDFDTQCRVNINHGDILQESNEACLSVTGETIMKRLAGYAVWNTCPKKWNEERTRQKCQDEDEADSLLNSLPVFDKDSHVTYKNIFCARCNGAVNTSYWKVIFSCSLWFNPYTFRLSNDLLNNWCSVSDKKPGDFQLSQLKSCIPRFNDCFNFSIAKSGGYCQAECLRYAFPVVYSDSIFRNPQCALCNDVDLRDIILYFYRTPSHVDPPPMTILFDFSSTSKFSINVEDDVGNVVRRIEKTKSCSHDEVYDPYIDICKKIVPHGSFENVTHEYGGRNGTQGTKESNLNCSVVAYNKTDYEHLPNGKIFLKAHDKLYSNTTYRIDDNRLLLCVNFSKNYTGKEDVPGGINITRTTPKSLQLLTLIGSVVSMVSLILLLVTYILFAELRNLPGKIIINLAISLLLYQSVFFSAGKNDDRKTCLAVAVLLHFFVLSSFTWMNVMAYDMHRTFTNVSGVPANRRGNLKKRLMWYCLYAWGAPAIVVLTCVAVDQVEKGAIGYGPGDEEGCFISEPQAKLYSFVLPIALILIFNLFALGHTGFYIVSTRKRTQRITNQQHGPSVALICAKMASVMGVTWILGIAANLNALSFLWYPYVVLNSLQGFFIFMSFAASGKGLELYRGRLAGVLGKGATKTNEERRGNSIRPICRKDESHETQDTQL